MTASEARPRSHRGPFAAVAVLLALGVGLVIVETALRVRPALLGFERLAYLPEPLKLGLGTRFVDAYRQTGTAYFAAHATRPSLLNTVPDPRYGLLLGRPGNPEPATTDRPLSTDALGFRNPAVPDRTDLLFIGDSFTAGVSGASVWPVAELFATRTGHVLGRRTYQAACYGWGPRQYRIAVEELLPQLRPRWVVIATYLDNDFGDVWVYDGWKASPFETYAEFRMYRGLQIRTNPGRSVLDRRSMLWNMVRFRLAADPLRPIPLSMQVPPNAEQYRTLPLVPMEEIPRTDVMPLRGAAVDSEAPGARLRVQFETDQTIREVDLRWRAEDVRTSARALMQLSWWPPYADALAQTVEAVHAANARALIVLIPSVERVLAPGVAAARLETTWPYGAGVVPDGPARAVASLARTLDADWIDLGPPLRQAVAAGTFPFAPGDIHFSAAGHSIAADQISAHIRAAEAREDRAAGDAPSG